MFPSAPQNHHGGWSHHPAYDYWSKHSYTWHQGPHPEAAAGAGAGAGAGAAGAAEAAAGANANFAHARAPGMHYHYHGRGGFPGGYRRFGGGRRLVWFGLGIAATAWYYKHQEHQREWHAKAIADKPDSATKHFWTNGCDNTWSHGWRRSAHEYDSKEASAQTTTPLPQPQVQMHAMPTTSTLPAPSSPTPNQVSDASRVLSALEQTPAFPTQIASPAEVSDEKTTSTDRRTWGWGERRRRRREASEMQEREARAVVAASMEQPSINTRDGEAEMKRLREVVEALWNDRKLTAATAQAQANDQAKEYAREKLDRLSGVLESLRESLKTDAEKIMDKKLV